MGMTPGIRGGGGGSSSELDLARMEDYGNGDDSVPFDPAAGGGSIGSLNANNVPAFSGVGNTQKQSQQLQQQAWSLPNGQLEQQQPQQQQQYQIGYVVDPAQQQQQQEQFLGNGNINSNINFAAGGQSSSSQQQLSPMEFLQQQQQHAQVMGVGQLDPLQPQQQQLQQFEGAVANFVQGGIGSAPGGGAVVAPSLQQELTSDPQQLEQQQLLQRLQEQEALLQKLQEQQQQNQPLDDGTNIGVEGASGVGGVSDAEMVAPNPASNLGSSSNGDGLSSSMSSSSVLESLNNFNDSWDPYDPKSVPMFWHSELV